MAKNVKVIATLNIEDSETQYVSIVKDYVSILFTNGIRLNITKNQLDAIVEGVKKHENVQAIMAQLA